MFSGWADKDVRHTDEAVLIYYITAAAFTAFMLLGFFFML